MLKLCHRLFHLLQELFGLAGGASGSIHQGDARALLLQDMPTALEPMKGGFHVTRMHSALTGNSVRRFRTCHARASGHSVTHG